MGFLIGFGLFFLAIVLTLIFGGISKRGDRLVAREGRVTKAQHPPTSRRDTELHA